METTLKISGMTCNHCVMAVSKALKEVAGVEKVEVSLERGEAKVSGSALRERLVAVVKEEGYEVL
ncbi:MAG: cation transporter [Nitrospirota bacterium]|nr:cation transporter [Nitrospirota bacterium]